MVYKPLFVNLHTDVAVALLHLSNNVLILFQILNYVACAVTIVFIEFEWSILVTITLTLRLIIVPGFSEIGLG